MTPVLEVIACSVADAVEAEKGGAGRLEIVRDLARGGLTPPIELVVGIRQKVELPLRVMLRESDGYETSSADEIDRLCAAAVQFASLGVDGFVLGFLKDGQVDVERTQRVLACEHLHARQRIHAGLYTSAADRPPKIVLVTSGQAGEGKTTTAVNTAISLSQLGASVLIIDCDMRKPATHKLLKVDHERGLSTYLSRDTEITELIQQLPIGNLSLLPCGPIPP